MARDKYLVRVGLNYPPNNKPPAVRVDPPAIVDDIAPQAIPGLLQVGAIEGPLSKERLAELAEAEPHGPELLRLAESVKVVKP